MDKQLVRPAGVPSPEMSRLLERLRRVFQRARQEQREPRPSQAGKPLEGEPVRLGPADCLRIVRHADAFLRSPYRLVPDRPEWRAGQLRTEQLQELHFLHKSLPDRVVYMDIETCGLSQRPVFLVGMLLHDRGKWVVEQYFARNYEEEPAVLEAFWRRVSRNTVLVTFNGRSFDLPYLQDRSTYHRIRFARKVPAVHCDVLLYARRLWKYQLDLPNCRLQTLEYCLCGREREDDIPGREIPLAYDRFVRCGNTEEIHRILKHNFLDLVTLAELSFRVLHHIGG